MTMSEEYLQDYRGVCRMAYLMRPTENRHPIHERIYPRINFMQGANPKAIKELFNYCFVNCIYLSKNNEEVSKLPEVICQGVKDEEDMDIWLLQRNLCSIHWCKIKDKH
ncbi:hypothetical protein SLE2022_375410 [Rubroshorea leprosula]